MMTTVTFASGSETQTDDGLPQEFHRYLIVASDGDGHAIPPLASVLCVAGDGKGHDVVGSSGSDATRRAVAMLKERRHPVGAHPVL